jgi:hypothetical protein
MAKAKSTRREMTLADYLVIGLSPALIMLLVGSLVFFLLEVSYSGQYRERMMWVLGWFVFGAVLVARIAIQEGRDQAALFGFGLAGATALFAARYVDQVVVAIVLLAVVWWCTWKLTWDCTLIDDKQDASGEGLLQAARLAEESPAPAESPQEGTLDAAKTRPHSPGLWVVYFSLAALPLFGIGQLLIPSQHSGRRSYGFQLLMVYVAAGLGLLLATSFLGLRRYLRQRNLKMPARMSASWLVMGSLLAASLLLLALLLPRPQGEYSLPDLIDRVDQKLQQASRMAQMGNDHGEGKGRRIGDVDPKDQQPGSGEQPQQAGEPSDSKNKEDGDANSPEQAPNSEGDQQSGQSQQANQSSGGSSSDKQSQSGSQQSQSERAQSDSRDQKSDEPSKVNDSSQQKTAQTAKPDPQKPLSKEAEQQGKPQQDPSSRSSPNAARSTSNWTGFLASIAPYFKWFIYGALLLAAIILLIIYHERVFVFLAKLWDTFLGPFQRRSSDQTESTVPSVPASRRRPFSSFSNPFLSGAHRRLSPSALVVYTFEALEAWASERGFERAFDQTPLEFGEMLARRVPVLARDIRQAANLYAGVAYSSASPNREAMSVLEQLWIGFDRVPEGNASVVSPVR